MTWDGSRGLHAARVAPVGALVLTALVLGPSAASAQMAIVTDVDAVSALVPIEEEDRQLYEVVLVRRAQATLSYVTATVVGVVGIPLLVGGAVYYATAGDHDFLGPLLIAFGSVVSGGALIDLLVGISFDVGASAAFAEWRRNLGLDVAVGPTATVVTWSGAW